MSTLAIRLKKEETASKGDVETEIVDMLSRTASPEGGGLFRLISLKHEFPDALYRLLHPSAGAPQTTEFNLERKYFPYFLSNKTLSISSATVYLKSKEKDSASIDSPATNISRLNFNINGINTVTPWTNFDVDITKMSTNMKKADVPLEGDPIRQWTINAGINGLDNEKLDDALILLNYTASNPLINLGS